MHVYSGEPVKGIPYIEQAMRLDPAQQQYRHFLGTAYLVAGNYETAAAILKERVAITPTTDLSRALLASALGHLGRAEEARQIWRELTEINPRYSYSDHFGRLPFPNPADADQLTEGLRKAGAGGVTRRALTRMSAHGPFRRWRQREVMSEIPGSNDASLFFV